MKIGFSILSHKPQTESFKYLIAQLNKFPEKEIVIHHDTCQCAFDHNYFLDLSYDLIENPVRTYWSHTNNIIAILKTFKKLYIKNCDWYVTLSAECYPIKSVEYIIEFLEKTRFNGFLEKNEIYSDHYYFYKYFRKGLETKYVGSIPFVRKNGKFYYKPLRIKRKPQNSLQSLLIPFHGSDWFIVDKNIMKYLLDHEPLISTISHILKDVNKGPDINICPPEVVFQSIIGNVDSFNINNYNYRYINWENAINWHPNVLTMVHWDALKQTDALFARKFEWEKSNELIQIINDHLL